MTETMLTFNSAIEMVESLPESQQEDLIEIIRRRLHEKRRNEIARNIEIARQELRDGQVKIGSIEDLMKDLEE